MRGFPWGLVCTFALPLAVMAIMEPKAGMEETFYGVQSAVAGLMLYRLLVEIKDRRRKK
jgi:hypothetical protein